MKASIKFATLIFFVVCVTQFVNAQDTTNTPPVSLWNKSWVGNLNGSQAQYSNWSGGGVNSIAATASTVFSASYKKEKFGYKTDINLKYGQTRIDWDNVQKTDDLIRFSNKGEFYFSNEHWSAFALVDFKTQFDQGFNADNILVSNFFAPAFFQEGLGISYKPGEKFSAEAGLALKQTIVSDTSLSKYYGVDTGKSFRNEGGITIALKYKTPIMENTTYTGTLETFTNVQTHLINRTDFLFSNEVNGKINDFLSANIQFAIMYDRDFNNKLQIKQVLALGINVVFL